MQDAAIEILSVTHDLTALMKEHEKEASVCLGHSVVFLALVSELWFSITR